MKKLVLCVFLGLLGAGGVAAQQSPATQTPAERPARDSEAVSQANSYWQKHARDGYMSKDDAMKFKNPEGKTPDASRLRADSQGRISQKQWTAWALGAGDLGDSK